MSEDLGCSRTSVAPTGNAEIEHIFENQSVVLIVAYFPEIKLLDHLVINILIPDGMLCNPFGRSSIYAVFGIAL